MRGREERGNASLAVVACVLFVMVFFLGLADLGIFLVARVRAQTAADAAALAAAAELTPGVSSRDPAQVAHIYARFNGGHLVACDCGRGSRSVTVAVEFPANFLVVRAAGVEAVVAKARAEPDLHMGTSRESAR